MFNSDSTYHSKVCLPDSAYMLTMHNIDGRGHCIIYAHDVTKYNYITADSYVARGILNE